MKRARLLVLGLVFGIACSDPGSGPPQPGTLTLQFTTNVTTNRAAMIEITGPNNISAVQAVAAGVTVFSTEAGRTVKAIVTGTLASGPLLRFTVEDVNRVNSFNASIMELADQNNALRTSLSGHSVRIQK
jgi:hypothetical protein